MTADTVGGVWNYALELGAALTREDVEVTVAAMGGCMSASQRVAARSIDGLNVVDSDFKLEWMVDPWEDVERAGEWLLDIAAAVRPDLVHLNNYAHGTLPWKRPTLMVGHSCVYSWFEAVERKPPPQEWDRYRTMVRLGLTAAHAVTAPTAAMLQALERHYGSFQSAAPIYNGLSGRTFAPANKEPLIFAAGRVWDSAKNLSALDAVARDIDWPVYIAGSNLHPSGGTLPFQHAHLLGQLDRSEVGAWLGRASIYALPARYEPFGLSALEAALSGCALVLGDIPSLREVWQDAATYVDPEDHASIGDALLQLMENDDLREEQAARARQRAAHFTVERMQKAYLSLYRNLDFAGASPRSRRLSVRRPRMIPRSVSSAPDLKH